MTTFNIPLLNVPRQQLTTALNGQEVGLHVWFQPTDEHWYLTLEFPVGTPIISGKRIVLDSGLLSTTPHIGFQGEIFCRSLEDIASEPGISPWGTTHVLRYQG